MHSNAVMRKFARQHLQPQNNVVFKHHESSLVSYITLSKHTCNYEENILVTAPCNLLISGASLQQITALIRNYKSLHISSSRCLLSATLLDMFQDIFERSVVYHNKCSENS
ncbi:hypothetical protein T12_15423 [Trichinella patagoniensis]|uniref:Uncharacterized protein n=1 Tax=Trichinella patagoniensis TaxID=990121 RepID=A0A0V0ZNY6_9BILA|nr:hypothetical protein T12_15423 [Trichinella patagoniensis]